MLCPGDESSDEQELQDEEYRKALGEQGVWCVWGGGGCATWLLGDHLFSGYGRSVHGGGGLSQQRPGYEGKLQEERYRKARGEQGTVEGLHVNAFLVILERHASLR
jgi:hypothetical protein